MKRIGLIPIRGGSKRFKDKNIYGINGHPLFYYAAEAASKSGFFDSIVISSDNDDYLEIAKMYGYDTHKRKKSSSDDDSMAEDVMCDVINDIGISQIDWLFLIQATNPFQNRRYFEMAMKEVEKGVLSVVTYRRFNRFFIEDVVDGSRQRTQDVTVRKIETGMFWGVNVKAFLKEKKRIMNPFGLVEIDEYDDVDIDYFEDLQPHIPRIASLVF